MSEQESQRIDWKIKVALVVVGILLSLSVVVIGSHLLSSPYTIGQGITINNTNGPTIEIGEEVQPTAANQSPAQDTIDLGPYARFYSNGETFANVSGWTDTYLVLDELDVSSNTLKTTRNSTNASISGAAHTLQMRDSYTFDGAADVKVDVTGSTTLTLSQPSTSADYVQLKDANTGIIVADAPASKDTITATLSQNRSLSFDSDSVSITNPKPADGTLKNDTTSNIELDVDVSHPAFDNGRSVDVNFRDSNGNLIGSETLSSDGRANTTWASPDLGPNDWYVETNDSSTIHKSDTWTFSTPDKLYIRDEQSNSLLDSGSTTVTVRFFDASDDSETVIERSTTNGTIPLKGLPGDVDLVIDASADTYLSRSIIIRNIAEQQTVYLLQDSATTVTATFEVDDKTGDFPPETSRLLIRKPIQNSDNTSYQTIIGDTFGANSRVNAELEKGGRYRIVVENKDGAERSFGSFKADTDGDLVPLEIGEISISPPGQNGYVIEAREITTQYNNEQRDAIRIVYKDDSKTTNSVQLDIYEQFNQSNTIFGTETYTGNTFSETIIIPKTQENVSTWVVNYTIDRGADDEVQRGTTLVGDLSEPNWPLGQRLLSILGLGGVLLIAGLFGGRLSKIGGVVVTVIAWTLTVIGILAIPIEFLIAAMAIAVLFLVSSRGSAGGAPI